MHTSAPQPCTHNRHFTMYVESFVRTNICFVVIFTSVTCVEHMSHMYSICSDCVIIKVFVCPDDFWDVLGSEQPMQPHCVAARC